MISTRGLTDPALFKRITQYCYIYLNNCVYSTQHVKMFYMCYCVFLYYVIFLTNVTTDYMKDYDLKMTTTKKLHVVCLSGAQSL